MAAERGGADDDRLRAARQDGPGQASARVADDGEIRQEISVARKIRAQCLVSGRTTAETAAVIHDQCGPAFGTTWIRAYRMALGIALADVVAQIRARYEAEGRTTPRFSETLLSAYEGAQKRPGPEYLHYLCAVYQADPQDLGYQDPCFCGSQHHGHRGAAVQGTPDAPGTPAAPGTPDASASTDAPAFTGTPGTPAARGAIPEITENITLRTGPARNPGPGSGAVAGTQAGKGRQLSTVRSVPDPRDGNDDTLAGLPPGVTSESAPLAPVALVPATMPAGVWGEGPDAVGEADDDLLRRSLLGLIADAGAGVDGRFFGAADRIRRQMDGALLGASVSTTMLDQWEETAAGYGRQYRSVPPLRLMCDVLLDLGDVRRMCEERQPVEFTERLCRLAAKLAALCGMTMINVGDQRLARSFFRTARLAADETGDRYLRGWVAVRESMVPLYYGDPGEAAQLARAGGELAGRHACVANVMAPVMEARALARLASGGYGELRGALARARTALDRAHLMFDGLASEVRGDTAFGYTQRQLLFHQGDTLVTLGDHVGAEGAFMQSLQLYPQAEILDRSLITLGQARCRLVADEPEEALRLSRDTVLALPRQHRSGLVVRTARSLGDSAAAKHGDLPAIREYREALLAG